MLEFLYIRFEILVGLQISCTKTQRLPNLFLFAPLGCQVGKLDGSQETEIFCMLYDRALTILVRALPCSIKNISISCGSSRFPTRYINASGSPLPNGGTEFLLYFFIFSLKILLFMAILLQTEWNTVTHLWFFFNDPK